MDGTLLLHLAEGLISDGALARITSLSLCGNLFDANDVAALLRTLVCRPEATALHTLRLAHNVHIGVEGVRHLAAALARSDYRLHHLDLRGCRLGHEAGLVLARALGRARHLHLLTLADNALSDEAVLALLETRRQMGPRGMRITLAVQGNPVSNVTRHLVMLAHFGGGGGDDSVRSISGRAFAFRTGGGSGSAGSQPRAQSLSAGSKVTVQLRARDETSTLTFASDDTASVAARSRLSQQLPHAETPERPAQVRAQAQRLAIAQPGGQLSVGGLRSSAQRDTARHALVLTDVRRRPARVCKALSRR